MSILIFNINSSLRKQNLKKLIFFAYDLETHITHGARPNAISFHRLNELAGKNERILAPYEIDKCKKVTIVFDESDCNTKALDFLLKLKR